MALLGAIFVATLATTANSASNDGPRPSAIASQRRLSPAVSLLLLDAETPTCSDGIKNNSETGIDCGGTCAPCAVGQIRISGNKIFDKAGTQIVARGPECVVASADYVDQIDKIAATGANAVRILMTVDEANGMRPEDFDAVFARAVQHRMVIWVSMYTWDNDHNNPISAALGGGNFYSLTAPAGTSTCSRTTPQSCYLAMWDRPWVKSLMSKYRANTIIDASQEYISSGDAGSAAGRLEWANAAKMNVGFFRKTGYTHALTIMSNFEGRDLAAIVEHGASIRAVDTVKVGGDSQTMFAWQAYWSGSWYPSWQGSLLLGENQTISAAQAIHQILPTLSFPVEAGFDNYGGDTNTQYPEQIDQAAADGISWLWWSWRPADRAVECPVSGQACIDFVQKSSNGFAGAKPLTP